MRMREQNFEKQVREKMDELSFVPSAPVWEKVEEQIRKKKEKRRIVLWLFPLLVATGLGWWLIAENGLSHLKDNNHTAIQNKLNNLPEPTLGNRTQIPEKSANTDKILDAKKETGTSGRNTITNLSNNEIKSKRKTHAWQHEAIMPSSIDEPLPGRLATTGQEVNKGIATPVFNPVIYRFNADSVINSKSLYEKEIVILMKDTILGDKQTKQNKWQIAFAVKGGIAGISEGFGSLGSLGSSADMLYYASPTASTGGFNSGNTGIPPSSSPRAGAAFSAGVDVKRKMNNRLAVVSGLHYAYYSNSIKVGSSVYRDTNIYRFDASVFRTEAFYRNDAYKRNYTNRYHYIQLPISADYKLNKRLPLYVQAGVKLEQLLSTNALFYNQQAGVYVKDEEMLVKTGVHLFSGFSYHFRSQKSFSFTIGPQIQYGITNLSKNKGNNQHLYFAGISSQIFFKK
jgi:hypothetical protein